LVEGLRSNIGGFLTLISSVPNIIVGNTAGISFVTFFVKGSPYVFVATLLTIWMDSKLFKIKRLTTSEEREAALAKVNSFVENALGTGALLVSAAGFSSVTDNIPLAAMLAKTLGSAGTPGESPLWWAVIFGANLGGNLTPIGSASTLVAVTIIQKYKLPMTFGGFVAKALPFALIQIALATAYVLIILR